MPSMIVNALANIPPRVAEIDTALGDDTLAQLVQLFASHGDSFRVYSPLLGKDLFVLSHPDHVRHVLVDNHANFSKGIGIERVAILLGNGLMTSDGPLWRSQRKSVQPAFHRSAVQGHIADIVAANLSLAQRLAGSSTPAVDITRELSEVTLEIVLRAIFGAAYERIIGDDNPFAILTAESERDLKFAYAFRQLGTLLQREIDRRRDAGVKSPLSRTRESEPNGRGVAPNGFPRPSQRGGGQGEGRSMSGQAASTPQRKIRLTMAQALVRHLAAQRTLDAAGNEVGLFAGVFAIFGHGNVAALGEALYAERDALPTSRAHNEQAMAHAAIGFAKATKRRRMMACTTSIGPGATNLVTAAALAHVNRRPLLLSGSG